MDSIKELEKNNKVVQAAPAGQVVVETEEERRIRLQAERAQEIERRREAFGSDENYIAKKRLDTMCGNITLSVAKKRVDEMLKVLDTLLKDQQNYMFVTSDDMARRVLSILDVYEAEIKRIGNADKRVAAIDRYRNLCQHTLDEENRSERLKKRDRSITSLSSDMMEKNDDEELENAGHDGDNTLSAATMEGVRKIDRWMLRHMHETGLTENDKFAFVSKLLQLSARERLYMYYIIEKGHRHEPMVSDVVESQLSYVPDKDAFASRMKMSKLRLFRRAANGSIYWDKLSDAYSQLPAVRDTIKKYSKIDQNATESNRSRSGEIVDAYVNASGGNADPKKVRRLRLAIKARSNKLRERDEALLDFRDSLIILKKKKSIADSAWFNKSKKRREADNAAAEAHNRLQRLIDADSAVGSIEQFMRTGNADDLADHLRSDGEEISEEGFDRFEDIADTGDRFVSHVGDTLTNAHDTIADIAEKALDADSQFLGISQTHLANMSIANVSALSVLAITSVLSAVSAFIELKKGASGMMGGDVTAAGIDLFSQAVSAVDSVFSAVTTGIDAVDAFSTASSAAEEIAEKIADAAEEAVDKAGQALSDVEIAAKVIGVGAASLGLVANTAIMINSASNSSYLTTAAGDLERKREAESGTHAGEHEDERKKRLRREKYEDSLLRHRERVLKDEKVGTAISMVSNAALLGASLTGGVISPVFAGISIVTNITSTIRDSIVARRQRKEAIDDYLGIAGYDNMYLMQAFENYLDNSKPDSEGVTFRAKYLRMKASEKKSYKKKIMDKLRTGIRNEIMAKMGCATKTAFFNMIMEKYGDVLYEGAFMDGDNAITDPGKLAEAERLPYVNFIKSLGLKIKFTENGIMPTRAAIVSKLQG